MAKDIDPESEDIIERKKKKIKKILPGAVVEGKLDVQKLKEMFDEDNLQLGEDKYDFSWAGESKAYELIREKTKETLKPQRDRSVNFEDTENIFIEGDNLDALKVLQRAYSNSVKMIYIDPPYNTGSDFVYRDDFRQSKEEYEKDTGQRDSEGNKLVANPKTNGRFHSDWLTMMYPRLFLARNLLKEDGAIFVSIDDNEIHNLRMIMNDIFGEENFVTTIIWEKVHTRKNSAKYFSESHDYIVCYAKSKEEWERNLLPREDTSAYSNPDNDPRGPWKTDPITAHNPYSADYKIEKPNGVVLGPPEDRYWAYSKESWEKFKEEGRVIWGEGDSYPKIKRYLNEVQDGLVPTTLWERAFAGDNSEARGEMKDLFDGSVLLDYPKPTKLIQRLMQISTDPNNNDIVMDFFAGSATTGHAVYRQNQEDGGNRRFVCIQLDEETEEGSSAKENGYNTISEVGIDRLHRAVDKIKESSDDKENEKIDLGVKVLKVIDSNFVDWAPPEDVEGLKEQMLLQEDPWKPGSDKNSIIYELILKEGFNLNSNIQELEEAKEVYEIKEGEKLLYIDLSEDVDPSIVEDLDLSVETTYICKDSALTDTKKRNLSELVNLKAI